MPNCQNTASLLHCSNQGCSILSAISALNCKSSRGSRKAANSNLVTWPVLSASIQVKAQVSSLRCFVPMTFCRSFSEMKPFSLWSINLNSASESKQGELAIACRQDQLVSLMRVYSASIWARVLRELMESMCCWQQAIAVYQQFYRIRNTH